MSALICVSISFRFTFVSSLRFTSYIIRNVPRCTNIFNSMANTENAPGYADASPPKPKSKPGKGRGSGGRWTNKKKKEKLPNVIQHLSTHNSPRKQGDALIPQATVETEIDDEIVSGEWKWPIRKRIWDLMEKEDFADQPRPVHHRIPNFVGAQAACNLAFDKAKELADADTVKINPDTPQKPVRLQCLKRKQQVIVPQPRLKTGFFSRLDPNVIPEEKYKYCTTQAGAADFGSPIDIHAVLKIDCVVIGSVAVNPANGARIGKGEGFADLEYGMSRLMGAVDDSTPIVTVIHDCQLVDDIPTEKMMPSDVPVDVIITPTRVIRPPKSKMPPKPKGIYWELLSPEKLAQVKVLRDLKAFIENRDGVKLPSGKSRPLPPTAQRNNNKGGKGFKKKGKGGQGGK